MLKKENYFVILFILPLIPKIIMKLILMVLGKFLAEMDRFADSKLATSNISLMQREGKFLIRNGTLTARS
jgi:hypothetical protein